MTRVLVTGATGFTGSVLTRKLAKAGLQVHAIARASSRLDGFQDVNAYRNQVRDERNHVPAAMKSYLDLRPNGPEMLDDLLVRRPVPLTVLGRTHNQGSLGAQVIADPDNIHTRSRVYIVQRSFPFCDMFQPLCESGRILVRCDQRRLSTQQCLRLLEHSPYVTAAYG
jgi:hypothetical protein